MMIKKLTKFGNSIGIVIPSEYLTILNLAENGEIEITTDGRGLYLKPVTGEDNSVKLDLTINLHINSRPP